MVLLYVPIISIYVVVILKLASIYPPSSESKISFLPAAVTRGLALPPGLVWAGRD